MSFYRMTWIFSWFVYRWAAAGSPFRVCHSLERRVPNRRRVAAGHPPGRCRIAVSRVSFLGPTCRIAAGSPPDICRAAAGSPFRVCHSLERRAGSLLGRRRASAGPLPDRRFACVIPWNGVPDRCWVPPDDALGGPVARTLVGLVFYRRVS